MVKKYADAVFADALMERAGIKRAAAFDRHFSRAGFKLISEGGFRR